MKEKKLNGIRPERIIPSLLTLMNNPRNQALKKKKKNSKRSLKRRMKS